MPGVAVVQNKPWKGIPNCIVYQKGAWTLHMLRGKSATAKFWAGIREYYRRYRDANASTADFRKVMEGVSGTDLAWFFDQWLYRAGSPVVEGGWKYDAHRQAVTINLTQSQAGAAYRLPLEFAIPGRDSARLVMTQKSQTFEVASPHEPSSVKLDPGTSVLMDATFTRQ